MTDVTAFYSITNQIDLIVFINDYDMVANHSIVPIVWIHDSTIRTQQRFRVVYRMPEISIAQPDGQIN